MSRQRSASNSVAPHHYYQQAPNEAFAYPFSSMNRPRPQAGPIEGPGGRRLIRRVTWRSSSYKLLASLWVLGMLYLVWLIRDLFYSKGDASGESGNGSGSGSGSGSSGGGERVV